MARKSIEEAIAAGLAAAHRLDIIVERVLGAIPSRSRTGGATAGSVTAPARDHRRMRSPRPRPRRRWRRRLRLRRPVSPKRERTSASGDISLPENSTTSDHVVWSQRREGAYMQTPLVYRDQLYVCRDNGVMSVFEAETGKRLYQQRLADGRTGFSASAVAGDGKIYYTSEEGSVFVLKAGPVFEQLAENVLGETAMATPAISEGMMFFWTRTRLMAVAE